MPLPLPGLPDDLEDVLWDVARERLPAGRLQPRALAEAVTRLSACYTTERAALGRAGEAATLAARLLFFTPSDAPRVAVPLGELDAVAPLPPRLRVLDLGAGAGAMTFGLLASLRRRGGVAAAEIVALDRDRGALELLAAAVARARPRLAPLEVALRTAVADLGDERALPPGPFDLVLAGTLLNELHAGAADGVARRAALIGAAAARLAQAGAVIVIEPALRDTARALERVRGHLLEAGLRVFAPCPHAGPCPMLARERDWCHEARRGVASPRLAALARATGLRHAELRFAYLTVRREGPTFAAARDAAWRVVSNPLPAKGMIALELCGAGRRVRVERLDRDATAANAAWGDLGRGDVVRLEPAPGEGDRARLGREHRVTAP